MAEKKFNYDSLSRVLGKSVNESGEVNYPLIQRDNDFKKFISQIRKVNLEDSKSFPDKIHKLAFWINVYNAFAIKTVLDYAIPENSGSIKKIKGVMGDVWNKEWYEAAGKKISLGEIEHKILRDYNGIGDPRIHFSIVCASKDCPPLRQEAYTPEKLEEQLEDQTKRFMHNKKYLEKGYNLGLVRILKASPIIGLWFKGDFKGIDVRGKRYKNAKDFIKNYASPEIRRFMHWPAVFIVPKPYDWNLNSQKI